MSESMWVSSLFDDLFPDKSELKLPEPKRDDPNEVLPLVNVYGSRSECQSIHRTQSEHAVVVDQVLDLYRTLSKTPRLGIRIKIETLWGSLKRLGESYGVARASYPTLDHG